MIITSGISLAYGQRVLFKDVNITFNPSNCYGLIGANGAGKSTFLKLLSGEITPDSGSVVIDPKLRLAVLKQNHYEFDAYTVLETVIMGHKQLYEVTKEKDALYAKPDFSDEDGVRAGELEGQYADMSGWDAEPQAARLLEGMRVKEALHSQKMAEIDPNIKVRVLLAQALFGNPDILLLDEPTNHLDVDSVMWLEEFLYNFDNTVIVVSHDRHFLDKVCTHVADIDYGKIQIYSGNYSFWYESSQLALRQKQSDNKKKEDRIAELQSFIQRFSANASKSKQATSRKKLLDKITLDDIKPSNRKYPFIQFKQEREAGKVIFNCEDLSASKDGKPLFRNFSMILAGGDKIAFVGHEGKSASGFFDIIMGEAEKEKGMYQWGQSITTAYFPNDNSKYFDIDLNLVDWLRQYSKDKDEAYIRGYLGKMLFSGDESQKSARVLSGGERVRLMLSRMMLMGANVLILDEPTNHLDLESITALNDGLKGFPGTILFSSQDHQFVQTISNRIIELAPKGYIDRKMSYDDYLESKEIRAQRDKL